MRQDKVPNGEYRVTWTIDVPAKSYRHAAEIARDIMIDLKSEDNLATFFLVEASDGSKQLIDLLK